MIKKSKTTSPAKSTAAKKAVIASRRSCPANGTGLSHYIAMDKKSK